MLVEIKYGVHHITEACEDRAGFAYTTNEELQIGDIVLLPGNWVHTSPMPGTVCRLDSSFDGECKPVTRRLLTVQQMAGKDVSEVEQHIKDCMK